MNVIRTDSTAAPKVASAGSMPPAGDSDADLLQLMAWAGEYPQEAQAAFGEFHRRHAEFLFTTCTRRYGHRLPNHYDADDLVGDTLKRAFERAETFDAGGLVDPERLRRLVRRWLLTIAFNILQDEYRRHPTLERSRPPEAMALYPEIEPPEETEATELVTHAFKKVLSDREAEVLRVTLQWYRVGKEHQRLPHDVAKDLAEQLGTSTENVRKIRERAIAKVEQFLRGAGIEDLLGTR